MSPLSICSSYFEVVISFKPFNSTGAISFSSNHFNGVSFEWALTHRSFPRILPDSSNFPGAILKSISKFDVRMSFHQSYSFSKITFKLFSSLVHHFYSSLFRSVSTIGWCFSSSFSDFEERRRVPLKSLPVLPEIHGSSFMPSSHNCF